ncbi:MAG: hypothetical protein A2104_06645 [Candidatus Melainabacteria bacterium GWF2_32_7]|nr:MAG: hypothetical protein A2104_06645 [Candidatus Melainabacteria bacterium GWF2_32_7]
MQTVVVMCGFPGCGKTTYVKTQLKDYVRFSLDDLAGMLTQSFDLRYSKIYEKLENLIINELISKKYNIVVDKTFLTQKSRRSILSRIITYATKAGLQKPFMKLIVIETPIDICIKRNKALKKVPPGIHNKMIRSFEEPSMNEGWDEIIRIKGHQPD